MTGASVLLRKWFQGGPAAVVRACVALALLLMLAGHLVITGQTFDRISGERYNLFTRWVSDYAGQQPEGWWIKAGIYCFCAAALVLARAQSVRAAVSLHGAGRALFLQGTAALMIGGLVLVAIFDISPRQVEVVENEALLAAADRESGRTTIPSPDPGYEEADDSPLHAFSPDGPTLRSELLRDQARTDAGERALLDYFREMQWTHAEVMDYLRTRRSVEEKETPDEAEPPAAGPPQLRRVPLTARQKSKEWYHRLGFQIFLAGFIVAALHAAWREWQARDWPRLPGTVLSLVLTAIFAAWLSIEKLGLAGIPQRALLVLISLWLLREAGKLVTPPNSSTGSAPAGTA